MQSGLPAWVRPQDCNLVAYSGLAQTHGYNQATAVYFSRTYTDAPNAPCNLTVSSASGGSIFIEDARGAVVYQEPFAVLYNFDGITFTNCGASGRTGPNLTGCISFYYAKYGAWTNNTAFFNVLHGVQVWDRAVNRAVQVQALLLSNAETLHCNTASCSTGGLGRHYMIGFELAHSFTVHGASGGTLDLEQSTLPADLGGRPAVVSGTVRLAVGQTVYLVVGQSAGLNFSQPGSFGGGGGGTFVFLGDMTTPIMVAGVLILHAHRGDLFAGTRLRRKRPPTVCVGYSEQIAAWTCS